MDNSIPLGQKWCTQCHKTKDINEFSGDRKRPDGHRSYCKECGSKRRKRTCRECKEQKGIEELISVNPGFYYCVPCWEARIGKKKCIECKTIKDLQEFAEDKSRPDGYEYYCKDCRREHQPNKHAKKVLQRGTKRCIDCRTVKELSKFPKDNRTRDGVGIFCIMCCNEQKIDTKQEKDTTREHSDLRISQRTARRLRSIYRITENEYRSLFEQQKGLCAICGRPERKSINKMLCIDHNHRSSKVRALLCNACNTGLGAFEENIEYLTSAIEYLRQHE